MLRDTLWALANSWQDDWDKWVLHACFAINNAPSSLGRHLSPFFIDLGAHPCLQLSLPNLSEAKETPEAYSSKAKLLEEKVQWLLHVAQTERKAKLDLGRVDAKFAQGDLVLVQSKELLYATNIGKLRDQWEGPFKVIKEAAPHAYLPKLAAWPWQAPLPDPCRRPPTVPLLVRSSLRTPGFLGRLVGSGS